MPAGSQAGSSLDFRVVELSQSAREVADLAAAAREEQVNPRIEEVRATVVTGFDDSESAR